MSEMTHKNSVRAEIRAGVNDTWAVALGMIPLGLAFGLLVTQMGFAWFWAPILSFVIYAGSMEFLALTLITGGAGPVGAALYALLVNFRHVFYALNYPLSRVKSKLGKAYGVYALTDETYAVISSRRGVEWTGPRVITIEAVLQSGWVGGGILGALFGTALPFELKGMEFALVALFIVLAIESFVGFKDLSLPLTAALAAGAAALISPDNLLMIAMLIYFAVLLVRYYVPSVDRAMMLKVGHERPREQAAERDLVERENAAAEGREPQAEGAESQREERGQ